MKIVSPVLKYVPRYVFVRTVKGLRAFCCGDALRKTFPRAPLTRPFRLELSDVPVRRAVTVRFNPYFRCIQIGSRWEPLMPEVVSLLRATLTRGDNVQFFLRVVPVKKRKK